MGSEMCIRDRMIYNQIIEDIKSKPNKIKTLANTKLLFTIKTIERAGDHITNIAEEIFYTVTGELRHILSPNW